MAGDHYHAIFIFDSLDFDGVYGAQCVVGDLTQDDFIFPFRAIDGHGKYKATIVLVDLLKFWASTLNLIITLIIE